jgi:hypothetical protein
MLAEFKITMGFLRDCSQVQKFSPWTKFCFLSRRPSTTPAIWPRVGRGELAPSHLLASPPPSAPGSSRGTALWPPAAREFSPAWPLRAPLLPKLVATAPAASAVSGLLLHATPPAQSTPSWFHTRPPPPWLVKCYLAVLNLIPQYESS